MTEFFLKLLGGGGSSEGVWPKVPVPSLQLSVFKLQKGRALLSLQLQDRQCGKMSRFPVDVKAVGLMQCRKQKVF